MEGPPALSPIARAPDELLQLRSPASDDAVAASRLLRHAPAKVTVLGSGSYGTATAAHLARQGFDVWMLTRRPEVVSAMGATHRNPATSFSDVTLPYNLTATLDAAAALRATTLVVHCIPVQCSYGYLRALRELVPPGVPLVSTSKGLFVWPAPASLDGAASVPAVPEAAVPEAPPTAVAPVLAPQPPAAAATAAAAAPPPAPGDILMMSQLIPAALGRPQPVAVLSGPTFAEEVLRGFPSGAVVASTVPAVTAAAKAAFQSHTFRVWTSGDVVGVELAGALKNVYALAAGCVEGLGLGLNTTGAYASCRASSERMHAGRPATRWGSKTLEAPPL